MTITGATAIFAVFGAPVSHSLSPQMHNGWFADHGVDGAYVALPLASERTEEGFRALTALGLAGANVTAPFKESAANAADWLDPVASALGAANTLKTEGGRLLAYNTDAIGLAAALDAGAPDWREARRGLVIGAGGAAKAAVWALAQAGCRAITIANRTLERAHALADWTRGLAREAHALPWEDLPAGFEAADVIVNMSSLGLKGGVDRSWPCERARPGAIVFDAIYAPLETTLLREARAHNLRVVDGLGMLVFQGAAAFEIWTGIRPDAAKARARLLEILGGRP